ncbi:MAG: ornithine cyclodeaminase [Candidatus Bathyarchaeia archaeon]
MTEAGDLIMSIAEKSIDHIWGRLEVILGKRKGRRPDLETTLYKSVGLALQDVSTASVVYEKAVQHEKGSNAKI